MLARQELFSIASVGVDIYGVIECRPDCGLPDDRAWVYAIDLELLYQTRDYDAFGCLFGVMNFAGFEPVAAERGFPADVTPCTREQSLSMTLEAFSHSWISWADIEAIDWDEQATRPDDRLHEYLMDEHGSWRFASKGVHHDGFPAQLGLSPEDVRRNGWPPNQEWRLGNKLYRSETLTRKDAIRPGGGWAAVWSVMSALASVHGAADVRLVVWFDR